MKKITLLVASILLYGNLANATEKTIHSNSRNRFNFSDNEPIEFSERGITFYVFQNGEFDFNTQTTVGNDKYYRRNSNTTYGAPGVNNYSSPNNGGVCIEHDALGRVRRVGNVFINFDYNDRIKRIGSVYMSYNCFALDQIGGLKIIYNRKGEIIDMYGSVKGYRSSWGYSDWNANANDYNTNYYSSMPNNANNQYYYRKSQPKSEDKEEK